MSHTIHAALVVALLPLSAWPAPPEPPPVEIEVLSLSVSKLKREAFGKGSNPFNFFSVNEAEGGTVLFFKATPDPSFRGLLSASGSRLLSFRDDQGTDLLAAPSRALGASFFPVNRPLEISTRRDAGVFGVKIRSAIVPAPAANQLSAEGVFIFGQEGQERVAEIPAVPLSTGEVVRAGPVKIQFGQEAASRGSTTNQASPSRWWSARVLPDSGAMVFSVVLLSDEMDEPLVRVSEFSTIAEPVSHCFSAPKNKTVRVKVRYYPPEAIVEVPFHVEAGLGL